METPSTLAELEEQIWQLIPGADIDVDEETGHIVIYTNLMADEDGDLDKTEDYFEEDEKDLLDEDDED